MASSAKEKFEAAVKVIRGLPANGPFQPSYDLMLKFYSYYKQATEGKCTLPKPSFWDVVNKKKWEAWNKLGSMEKEEAMMLYVDELKKVSNHVKETYYPKPEIVETMPQTEEVSVFLQKLDTFYEMVEEAPTTDDAQDNNNVKDTDHPLPNGDVKAILNDSSQGQEDLNYSDNVTQLLKQDMKKAQESSGILVPEDRLANGHGSFNGSHTHHVNGKGVQGESDEEEEEESETEEDDVSDEEEDREGEEEEEEAIVREEASQKVSMPQTKSFPARKSGGKEEERGGGSRGVLGQNGDTNHWSEESETENEEFCDTSDEPVNTDIPLPRPVSTQPLLVSHSNIPLNASTPIPSQPPSRAPNSKPVRANGIIPSSTSPSSSSSPSPATAYSNHNHHHHHHHPNHQHHHLIRRHNHRILSDSLEVNVSGIDAADRQSQNTVTPTFALSSSQQDSSMSSQDMNSSYVGGVDGGRRKELTEAEVNCRGGEEEEGRDRRRKGGSQSSRGGSSSEGGRRRVVGTGGSDSFEGGSRPPYPNRGGGGGSRDPPSALEENRGDLNEQIVVTLLRLQRDMSGVLNRLHSLEALVKEGRREKEERKQVANKSVWWWPFPDLSFKSAAAIILWPIVLQVVLAYISRSRSRRLRK